jgi:hypothetical protein
MYGYSMDVPMPVEMYDRVHAEVERRLGSPMAPGCLLHLVTRTDGGFRVTEVWDSHEANDRFTDEVLRPVMTEVLGAQQVAAGPPPSLDLDIVRLQVGRSPATV